MNRTVTIHREGLMAMLALLDANMNDYLKVSGEASIVPNPHVEVPLGIVMALLNLAMAFEDALPFNDARRVELALVRDMLDIYKGALCKS